MFFPEFRKNAYTKWLELLYRQFSRNINVSAYQFSYKSTNAQMRMLILGYIY